MYDDRAHTVWTAPNGTADVILPTHGTWYKVRVKTRIGTWMQTDTRYLSEQNAIAAAREVDRFKPDGSGRFPVR